MYIQISHIYYTSRYATVRMEPQFMMLGHAAGVVAALSARHGVAVQDVDLAEMRMFAQTSGSIFTLVLTY